MDYCHLFCANKTNKFFFDTGKTYKIKFTYIKLSTHTCLFGSSFYFYCLEIILILFF